MILENISRIKQETGHKVQLVIVSKNRTKEQILEAYTSSHRVFAENRVQALLERAEELPKDIEWHIIGHLQTNKVKYIAGFISMIQSVDSMKLLMEINKQAQNSNRIIDCLLQVYIASEETKFGLLPEECLNILKDGSLEQLKNVRIRGLMGMASNTDDEGKVKSEFLHLKQIFDEAKGLMDENFDTLSMGMSSDYQLAISCGSNMVRVGSSIFEG